MDIKISLRKTCVSLGVLFAVVSVQPSFADDGAVQESGPKKVGETEVVHCEKTANQPEKPDSPTSVENPVIKKTLVKKAN